jgi:hypothetical protein
MSMALEKYGNGPACRCLEGNQTILVWFGVSRDTRFLLARQTRMVWLPRLQRTRLGQI